MKMRLLILILSQLLSILCHGQEIIDVDLESNKSNSKKTDFSFSVVVDMNDLQYSNDYNYKYLIKKDWDFNAKKELIYFTNHNAHFIRYKYINKSSGLIENYERIPIDTINFNLTNDQLDSIYIQTKNLFLIDSLINIHKKNEVPYEYDGEYVNVHLNLINYNTSFSTTISFEEDQIFQKRYKALEYYMNKIKNAL